MKSPIFIESADEYLQAPQIPARRPPPDIISYAAWLYYHFNLSHRGIEDLLAERGMRKFKSTRQAQQFLGAHAAVSNLYNLGRHMVSAQHYRDLGISAFTEWSSAVA